MTREASTAGSLTVRVWYDGNPGYLDGVEPVERDVVGAPDEAFHDALERTFGLYPDGHSYALVVRDGTHTVEFLGTVTLDVSMEQAFRVANGETLQIDVGGRGGGPAVFMLDLVNVGLTVAGLRSAGAVAREKLRAERLKGQRAEARNWVDAGTDSEPSPELRRYVFERDYWDRDDFDVFFNLDRASGSTLLRVLGYTKTSTDPEIWREPDPDANWISYRSS